MLQVSHLYKSYGASRLLADLSFVLNPGERLGLIGPNGSGKSTLLRIIAGEEAADRGTVSFAPGATLGYLAQGFDLDAGLTLGEAMLGGRPGYLDARAQLEGLARDLEGADGSALDLALLQYGAALERFEALGGYGLEHEAESLLAGLDLADLGFDQPIRALSGGQRTRLGLARLLLASPDILLLDEPTNHLDLEALDWLENFLAAYRGALLIVSHDRAFLDGVVNGILALDLRTGGIRFYGGGYSDYVHQREAELEKQTARWKDQQEEERRIREDIHRTKMHSLSVELTTTSRQPGVRRYAKKVAKKALSREKKLDRFLDSDERVEKPTKGYQLKVDFGSMPRGGSLAIELREVAYGWPGQGELFSGVTLSLRAGERIALLGPNGAGKSTLLKLIMGEIAPTAGSLRVGDSTRIAYMPQEQESLPGEQSPLDLIRRARESISESEARAFLHYFLFSSTEAFTPIRLLSYGQRARLLVARSVLSGANCLVLDEPLNHLDIDSRERFQAALENFPGAMLFTAHDRAFIDGLATGVWMLEGDSVRAYVDREAATAARVRSS